MSDHELIADVHVAVSPAGAYYATAGEEDEPARRLLFALMREARTPQLTLERLCTWSALDDAQTALALLDRMQSVGWVHAEDSSRDVPAARLERDMPELLAQLSHRRRALLADAQGFQLAATGFSHEAAEELAAFAADLAALHRRYHGLLRGNLRLAAGGLAAVDATGHSQLGLWPLAIGAQRFLLVIAGVPLLDRPAFADTVWGLTWRYTAEL